MSQYAKCQDTVTAHFHTLQQHEPGQPLPQHMHPMPLECSYASTQLQTHPHEPDTISSHPLLLAALHPLRLSTSPLPIPKPEHFQSLLLQTGNTEIVQLMVSQQATQSTTPALDYSPTLHVEAASQGLALTAFPHSFTTRTPSNALKQNESKKIKKRSFQTVAPGIQDNESDSNTWSGVVFEDESPKLTCIPSAALAIQSNVSHSQPPGVIHGCTKSANYWRQQSQSVLVSLVRGGSTDEAVSQGQTRCVKRARVIVLYQANDVKL